MEKLKIKSSSLLNAVFLCLLIAILCSAFILIASYNGLFREKLNAQQALIAQNNSAFNFFLAKAGSEETYRSTNDLDINSVVSRKKWGLLEVQTVKSFFKEDTVSKSALVVKGKNPANIALYLTDYDKILNLSGNIKIKGNIIIPKGHFEESHIGQEPNNIFFSGSPQKSQGKLPETIRDIEIAFNTKFDYFPKINYRPGLIVVNEFDNPTKVMQVDGTLKDVVLKGNIVVRSETVLHISKTAKLTDVLLKAPRIVFDTGFKGSIQAFAKQKIVLKENVHLAYPSILLGFSEDSLSIKIGENSTVLGSVILFGETFRGSLKRTVKTEENTLIVGDVYCYGASDLNGKIYGTLYADRLIKKTRNAVYENTLLNTEINREKLPQNFSRLLPLADQNCCTYEVVKKL